MKKVLFVGIVALFTIQAYAEIVVECSVNTGKKIEKVKLRMDDDLNIIMWDEKKQIYAEAKWETIFGFLGKNSDEVGIEYDAFLKTRNGYSLVKIGTTADEIKVGVHRSLTKGFYEYKDLGSGNGDDRKELICKRIVK